MHQWVTWHDCSHFRCGGVACWRRIVDALRPPANRDDPPHVALSFSFGCATLT
jgi:hypothetical protein